MAKEINNMLEVLKAAGADPNNLPIQFPEIDDTTEEWLHWREHGPKWRDENDPDYIPYTLGGSDTAKVLKLSPWSSITSLYYQKTGRKPLVQPDQNSDALVSGHIFEPAVAELLRHSLEEMDWITDMQFGNDTHMYRCGQKNPDGTLKYPWALADMDRIAVINGVPYVVELKTTTEDNKKTISLWKDGIVPSYYLCQVQHYMAVMNIDHAVICCAWGLRQDKSAIIFLERDMAAEEALMDAEGQFISCCELGIVPSNEDEDADKVIEDYKSYFTVEDNKPQPVELSEDYGELLSELQNAKKYLDNMKAKADAAEANFKRIQAQLLSAFVTKDGKALYNCAYFNDEETGNHISAVLTMTKNEVDSEALKKEQPDVYNRIAKSSVTMTALKDYDRKNKTSFSSVYIRQKNVDPSVKVTISPITKIDGNK